MLTNTVQGNILLIVTDAWNENIKNKWVFSTDKQFLDNQSISISRLRITYHHEH